MSKGYNVVDHYATTHSHNLNRKQKSPTEIGQRKKERQVPRANQTSTVANPNYNAITFVEMIRKLCQLLVL